MSKPETIYQTPPLAGRPPFATDDDSVYDNQPQQQPTRRIRQPPPPNPNARTSAYNVYDNYLDSSARRESGMGALGSNLLNGDMDDDDDPFDDANKAPSFDAPRPAQPTIPLAAPKPGYAAPVSGLKLAPSPSTSPNAASRTPSPQMAQVQAPRPLILANSVNSPTRMMASPAPGVSVPSTPHPLQPPMTPIVPAFVRPNANAPRDVKFAGSTPILRGDREETMLPKRGERGDDFWRRFSMVVKVEGAKSGAEKQSPWLKKTQGGSTRMSRWVWVIAVLLVLCIAGGIGLGWWASHNNPTKDRNGPTALGGSANEKSLGTQSASTKAPQGTSSAPLIVTPTHTVARRSAADPEPTGQSLPVVRSLVDKSHFARFVYPSRHKRINTNRMTNL